MCAPATTPACGCRDALRFQSRCWTIRCAASPVTWSASAADQGAETITRLLFPAGAPPLPDAMHVNGERMNMAYVVGVLMGNRDLERRLAAEAKGEFSLAA